MNKKEGLLVKIDVAMAFVDLKVLLLAWIMIDLYRNTALVGSMAGIDKEKVSQALPYVWENCGSPYLIWIPIAAIADIVLKRAVKALLD